LPGFLVVHGIAGVWWVAVHIEAAVEKLAKRKTDGYHPFGAATDNQVWPEIFGDPIKAPAARAERLLLSVAVFGEFGGCTSLVDSLRPYADWYQPPRNI
jgi:hypothetical protein